MLDLTDKFGSNIALTGSLLDMLYSLNNNTTNNSSTMEIDLLHMYIRQFLLKFDTRICLDRKTRKTCKKSIKIEYIKVFSTWITNEVLKSCPSFALDNYFRNDLEERFRSLVSYNLFLIIYSLYMLQKYFIQQSKMAIEYSVFIDQ